MDKYEVTDEGGGIIRVDADIKLVTRRVAETMCNEVVAVAEPYDGFKILMNMGAMSKGTPGAGFYVLREMKKYNLEALALFRANRFMRGMATTVLGLAGFDSFALFEDEAAAREWLKNAPAPMEAETAAAENGSKAAVLRRAVPVALVGGGLAAASYLGLRRRRGARAGA
jgi:hypothetical protein